jgi:putative peptidoglycan lipid II flippase
VAIIHRFFTVSGLTAVSRILGVAREALVSHILGASASMDALLIAYKFPNFFKKFFADGGFQSIFVPYYTDFVAINKNKGAGYFVSRVFTITFYVSLVLTTIVVIFAEEFVLLMASGFADDPDKLSLSADLTRIVFPSVVFIAACSVCSGLLIARKKFFFFAFQPILSNSVLIGILLMCDDVVPTVHYVATGYLIATISQFI